MTSQTDSSIQLDAEIRKAIESMREGDYIPPAFLPEHYALYLKPALFKNPVPFRGSSIRHLAEFILPALGMTREEFDKKSEKSLRRLFHEWKISDMHLTRNAEGKIIRFASNARTEVHVPSEGISLQEVGRTYRRTGHHVAFDPPKPHASSETMRRRSVEDPHAHPERPVEAAQAGIWEEYGIRMPLERFIDLTPRMPLIHVHESSVFAGITSVVTSWKFRLDLADQSEWASPKIRYTGDTLIVQDDDVLLHTKWLPIPLPSAPNW